MVQRGERLVQEVAEQVVALVNELEVMVNEQGVAQVAQEVVQDVVLVVESLVVKAIELEMAGEVVEAQGVVQEVQEAQEELEELEAQEVQDHHSRHLSPDHAALALLAHRRLVVLHRQGLQGRLHRRGAGQTH